MQISTVNQFHDYFKPMISEFNGPTAACGAFSVINAALTVSYLASLPDKAISSRADLDTLAFMLRDEATLVPEVHQAMKWLCD